MSKFGAHVSIGRRDGFGAALAQCQAAGSPVPVLFALDQNLWPDVQQYSPATTLIFRTQIDGQPNPPALWQADPVETAAGWYTRCRPIWAQNRAHYYAPGNEYDPQTLAHFDWLNAYELKLMQLADADGLKLAIGAHSTGTPSDDGGQTRYEKWARLLPSLQYAKAHGHILLLHEYGLTGYLRDSAPHLALRYRSALDCLRQFAADPITVISECSGFNGYAGQPDWFDDLCWYDAQVLGDPRVLGFCAYQLGGAENWSRFIPRWAEYVSAHPTPPVEPPPPQTHTLIRVEPAVRVSIVIDATLDRNRVIVTRGLDIDVSVIE